MYEYKKWQHWTYATADHTYLAVDGSNSAWRPSNHPETRSSPLTTQILNCKELSQIMVRAFGSNAGDEQARIRISGWMENGPGQILLDMDVTLGTDTHQDDIITSGGQNPFAGVVDLLEVDTYDITVNNCRAYSEVAGANETGYLVINTMQSVILLAEIDLDGAAVASATMGLIFRPLS